MTRIAFYLLALLAFAAHAQPTVFALPPTGGYAKARADFLKVPKVRAAKKAVPGQYIVVLDVAEGEVEGVAAELLSKHSGKKKGHFKKALKGFVASLKPAQAEALSLDERVAYVEEDGVVQASGIQVGATWGVDRLDQRSLPLDRSYTYPGSGAGVAAYIIDTGILAEHQDFGGRVSSGYDAIGDGYGTSDCNGHGTHVAGTVGGQAWGVAKGVKLVAVRVLGCDGSGTTSGVIAGVEWVTRNHVKPAVANMSLGGGISSALDTAVSNSIAAGVTYAVAAGNENADACGSSPARTPSALTVGATTSTDARSSFSNWGTCVDLFAPGSNIASTWWTSPTSSNTISGTSMASPHVAGVAALYLEAVPGSTPASVANALVAQASQGLVTSPGTGSPNRLLYSGFLNEAPAPAPAPVPTPAPLCATQNQLFLNPGFEDVPATWVHSAGVLDSSASPASRTGSWKAWLNGYGTSHTDELFQQVSIPADACSASLSFWVRISTAETTTTTAYDKLALTVKDNLGATLKTLVTYSNLHKNSAYVLKSFDLSAYKGRTVRLHFLGREDGSKQTSFLVDDAALTVVR